MRGRHVPRSLLAQDAPGLPSPSELSQACLEGSDPRGPGRLRSQHQAEAQRLRPALAVQPATRFGAPPAHRGSGGRDPASRDNQPEPEGRPRSRPTSPESAPPWGARRLPRGAVIRDGGARRAGARPRQLLSKMDAMCPGAAAAQASRAASFSFSAAAASLSRPGGASGPARADG